MTQSSGHRAGANLAACVVVIAAALSALPAAAETKVEFQAPRHRRAGRFKLTGLLESPGRGWSFPRGRTASRRRRFHVGPRGEGSLCVGAEGSSSGDMLLCASTASTPGAYLIPPRNAARQRARPWAWTRKRQGALSPGSRRSMESISASSGGRWALWGAVTSSTGATGRRVSSSSRPSRHSSLSARPRQETRHAPATSLRGG